MAEPNRCPRCGGWLYIEPDVGRGRWLKCLLCGWERWLGPGWPASKSLYHRHWGHPRAGRIPENDVP